MVRKLASVQYVHDVWPIAGADRIECIGVLGWRCVAKKGEFRVGDLCVYFEIDSFLPVDERFAFLGPTCLKSNELLGEGYRLRTQRFRGQVSQGLALPLSVLPEGDWAIGTDVTELLGVRKWIVSERATSGGTIIGGLPPEVPKTDETRVQAEPALIDEFKGLPYYITTKLDGTSVSIYRLGGRFGICGHNYELADDGKCSFWKWAHEHEVENRLSDAGLDDIVLQGEFCAAGIQGNPLTLKQPGWYVFTIRDAHENRRLGLEEMIRIVERTELDMVPLEERGDDMPYRSVEELLDRARGTYANGRTKEGIVVRPQAPVYSPIIGGSLSMKVINNDYLVKRHG
ncbi:MAG: RNA ligase family protein [Coriobacteriales bacterium]|nr:RNA ligase family protein [Coriobacteriales bacterium]